MNCVKSQTSGMKWPGAEVYQIAQDKWVTHALNCTKCRFTVWVQKNQTYLRCKQLIDMVVYCVLIAYWVIKPSVMYCLIQSHTGFILTPFYRQIILHPYLFVTEIGVFNMVCGLQCVDVTLSCFTSYSLVFVIACTHI